MNTPGFTAESSIYKSNGFYSRGGIPLSTSTTLIHAVIPQMIDVTPILREYLLRRLHISPVCLEQCYTRCNRMWEVICQFRCTRIHPRTHEVVFDNMCYQDCLSEGQVCLNNCPFSCLTYSYD
jgi:hypothetical protein